MSANTPSPAGKKSATSLPSPTSSDETNLADLAEVAILLAMHALIQKDPFPEPSRVIGQAIEYGEEFFNQRSKR